MLEIEIQGSEFWDSSKEEFIYTKPTKIRLEHSLISLTRWEQKYKKPFLESKEKTPEEVIYYIRCMCLDKNVDPLIFDSIDAKTLKEIMDYINDPMTATKINDHGSGKGHTHEVLTSEVLYYYMTALNIPFECEKWHLNNLITLIKVASAKNNPKKMSKGETLKNNWELNKIRRAKLHTKG